MSESRYGYAWCPDCEYIRVRRVDIEPLPRCRCGWWMEPLLCDVPGCENEATIIVDDFFYCGEHRRWSQVMAERLAFLLDAAKGESNEHVGRESGMVRRVA